jgi:hypothetical protein
VQADRGESENGIGKGVLTEERAVARVHEDPQGPGDADARFARLVNAPEGEHQRHHVGQPDDIAPGQQVEEQREHEGERDVARPHGRQDALRLFVKRH